MKCKNCSHNNAENTVKCVECNAPLNGSMILEQSMVDVKLGVITCKNCSTTNAANLIKCTGCNAPLAGTNISEQNDLSVSTSIMSEETISCQDCGYPNVAEAKHCTACLKPLSNINQKKEEKKEQKNSSNDLPVDPAMTINPWVLEQESVSYGFSLIPLVKGELKEKQKIDFIDKQVNLNRSNLDPQNTTITNKSQATIKHTDDGWVIENNSELGTTFIQVIAKRHLQEGDVILMGNMMYKFATKN